MSSGDSPEATPDSSSDASPDAGSDSSTDSAAAGAGTADPTRTGKTAGVGHRLRQASWVLLVISIVAVGFSAWSWQQAEADPDLARAVLRDQAIVDGTRAIEVMNTMDHQDVAGGLEAWRSVTTGVMRDQLVAMDEDQQELLADQGKVATGHVTAAALTALTDRTATMIAAVEVTVADQDPEVEPTVKRNRYSADLVLVEGQWKIENLGQVPVNLS